MPGPNYGDGTYGSLAYGGTVPSITFEANLPTTLVLFQHSTALQLADEHQTTLELDGEE